MQEIKAHLELHKFLYWERLDVRIRVQCRLSRGVPKREFKNPMAEPLPLISDLFAWQFRRVGK